MKTTSIHLYIALMLALWIQTALSRCPNWCNQRGECTSPAEGGYCVCHYGFTGEDCSQRLCPAGFDPVGLAEKPNRRTVRMELGHMGGLMMGKYSFHFAGSEVYFPANANDNDEVKCNSALKGLASVSSATCKRESFNANTGTGMYLITLQGFPDKPYMNNIVHHNGNPAISLFACNVSKIDAEEARQPFCFLSDTEPLVDFPLYAECSNHGICDRVSGVCACERGFKGDNCFDTADNEDIFENIHDGPFFSASVLKINALRTPSAGFNLLQAQLDGRNVTTIRGDRLLEHLGDVRVSGAITIRSGRSDGDMSVQALPATVAAATASIKSIISSSSEDSADAAPEHHLLAYHEGQLVHSVSAQGDALFAGCLRVLNASLTVEPSLISGHNLRLQNNLHVEGSANVEESLTIGAGFALTPGGMTVDVATHTGTLFELKSRQQGFNGTLMELNSVGDSNVLIRTVSSGLTTFELHSSGDVRMNGLRLASGGVNVQAGGIEVEAGGVQVQGGLSVLSGGLTLDRQPFVLGSLRATGTGEDLVEPLLSAQVTNKFYTGDVLSLAIPADANSSADGRSFLHFSEGDRSILRVRGSGMMESASGAVFRGSEGLEVHGSTLLKGKVRLHRAALLPKRSAEGESFEVAVPAGATYVVISPAPRSVGEVGTVEVIFDRAGAEFDPVATAAGRVVLLTNLDERTTSGEAAVPPQSTVMMLFDGSRWVSVDALKAPMHELKHVRTLEASNDLHIGNHSLSALRFQATGLRRHSVVFAAAEGVLADSDKLTYTKGVLATPALRVDKILGDIDMRGNDISNAQLTKPRIVGGTITAQELSIPGHSGLAYFTTKGALAASAALALNDAGHLLITDTYADINAHSHELRNVHIRGANLSDIGTVSTGALFLTGSAGGGLLMTQEGGRVVSAQGAIAVNAETGDVAVKSLSAAALSAPLDVNHHTLSNVVIAGGTVERLTALTTNDATVVSLRDMSGGGESAPRLVFADAQGKLQAQRTTKETVHIPHLAVQELQFLSPEIDFQGRKVKNIVLDSETFALGPQRSISTEQLVVSGLSKGATEGSFITADAAGKIGALSGVSFANGVLDVATSTVSAAAVRAQKLTLSTSKEAAFLSTDAAGEVVASSALRVDSVTAKQGVTIATGAVLTLQGREGASLLSVDSQGAVVATPKPSKKTASASSVDAALREVSALTLAADSVTATKVSAQELHLGRRAEETDSTQSGSVLVQSKSGKVSALSEEVLRVEKGVVSAAALQSVSPDSPLLISSALLLRSNISASHIHDAASVSTRLLSVSEQAEFLGDVVVDGGLTVHGTVVGSGPYVDSSDARFKKDVHTIDSALDTVKQLRGVTYNFRTEEFPSRSFPAAPQMGFIAQEVEAVAPALVSRDGEGYGGVAYAHVTALLTEALKELQQRHDAELAALREELALLKEYLPAVSRGQRGDYVT